MPTKTTKSANNADSRYLKVSSILVSQPKPERSPYFDIETKYGIRVDWRSFIQVDGFTEKEFRRQRIRMEEFPFVVFTSRNAIDNFFRLAEEMRARISENTKYFCATENIANYLQKFILYRKRKVFLVQRNSMTSPIISISTRIRDSFYCRVQILATMTPRIF